MQNKKIILAGGTGFIGNALANYFGKNNTIVILTRGTTENTNNAFGSFLLNDDVKNNVQFVQWDVKNQGSWSSEVNGSNIVINLCGKSVNCKYTEANKKAIIDSRVQSTSALAIAIANAKNSPTLFINAASATIYKHAIDEPQDEFSSITENDFSVQVCKIWEQTFFDYPTPNTRKVALRIAITLGNGGLITPYLNLCKYGLAGKQGNGKQLFSWIHIEDFCRLIQFAYENNNLQGSYNAVAPNPVSNKQLMKTFRDVTGNKFGLPAYEWMLKIGAWFIGTELELILKSRWVMPTKLLNEGFTYKYHTIKDALQEIVSNIPRKKYNLF